MKTLDRLIVVAYARSYLICLISLLILYIVIDLFTNLNDFFDGRDLVQAVSGIGRYYLYRSSQIFDRLCEPILLLAATFTVAWMQRSNELLPLLSAGIYTGEQYCRAICDTLDALYEEEVASGGKVMAVPIHPFYAGLPMHKKHFDKALEYVTSHPGVWVTTSGEIADWFYSHHYGNS